MFLAFSVVDVTVYGNVEGAVMGDASVSVEGAVMGDASVSVEGTVRPN